MAKRLIACAVLVMFTLAVCIYVVSAASKPGVNLKQPHTIAWNNITFTYQVQKKTEYESSLLMTLTADDSSDMWITHLAETYRSNVKTGFSDIALVVPIKVKAQDAPQLLVMSRRPNWTDYNIYVPGYSEITEGFGFSTRYLDSIKWIVKNGELEYFIVFDRYAVPPKNLEDEYPYGERALRSEYRYDSEYGIWKVAKKRWIRYKGDEPTGGQWTEKPSDINFEYKLFIHPSPRSKKTSLSGLHERLLAITRSCDRANASYSSSRESFRDKSCPSQLS